MASSDGIISAVWPAGAVTRPQDRSLADLPDDALMSLVVAENQAAFAILMRRHARLVLAVGRRILHDQGAAEELVQDVFLLIYRRSQLFDPERGSFRAWLVQIAYHEAYRARQRVSLRHVYEDRAIECCLDVLEASVSPEFHAFIAQREEQLRQAFRRLPRKQQQTMELFFFDGYTLREISERLGESLGNVRHHYYRALKKLKDGLGSAKEGSHA